MKFGRSYALCHACTEGTFDLEAFAVIMRLVGKQATLGGLILQTCTFRCTLVYTTGLLFFASPLVAAQLGRGKKTFFGEYKKSVPRKIPKAASPYSYSSHSASATAESKTHLSLLLSPSFQVFLLLFSPLSLGEAFSSRPLLLLLILLCNMQLGNALSAKREGKEGRKALLLLCSSGYVTFFL